MKPRPPAKKKTARGFTIVEVMMAAIVMAFAITTAITTMQRAFLALDTARNLTQANQIMQSEIERLRLKDWTTVNAYSATATAVTIDSSYTNNAFIGSRFTLTRVATDVAGHPLSGMKQVTFTISWNSYDRRTLSRSLTVYYGQNGLYDYFYNQT
ncbi:MAG: type II secretion system protein [Opitutae bacterium]|nr:type II secretion system protein [Opitutae bacterium]